MSDHATRELLGEEIDLEAAEQDVEKLANTLQEKSEETKTEESVATGDEEKTTQEQEAETKEETSEESTEESELDRLNREFTESGQGNYHSGISDMIAKASDKDKYIAQLQADLAAQRVTAQPKQPITTIEPFKLTADDLVENPQEAIEKIVNQQVDEKLKSGDYVTRAESAQQQDENSAMEFKNSNADFAKLEPAMRKIAADVPGIQYMPLSQSVRLLHRLAKAEAVVPENKVKPADVNKKERASTSGGTSSAGTKPTGKGRTREQYEEMTEDQIEKDIGFSE